MKPTSIWKKSRAKRHARNRPGVRLQVEALEPRTLFAVLTSSTYLGGSNNDRADAVAAGADGSTYVVGQTYSNDLVVGSGANDGRRRGFLAKFDPLGQLVYKKLLGPVDSSEPYLESDGDAVAVGPDGLPIVSYELTAYSAPDEGGTRSVTSATRHILKLSASGTEVVFDRTLHSWSVFADSSSMAVDETGAVYVSSLGFDNIPFGIQASGFIDKVDAKGMNVFSEPFNLEGQLAVDAQHNIYIATSTSADGLGVSPDALQSNRMDGGGNGSSLRDLYIAELDPTGSTVVKATYLGGVGDDILGGLAVNPNEPGTVYLTGTTFSAKFPVTTDAYQSQSNTSADNRTLAGDGFIAKLDLTQMKLVASTYFGGNRELNPATAHPSPGKDSLTSIAVDLAGNVYVAGSTNSQDFPVSGPLQARLAEGPAILGLAITYDLAHTSDFVIAKFDSALQSPSFSTYFGGYGQEDGAHLALDTNGTLHVAGTSSGAYRYRLNPDGSITDGPFTTDNFPVLNNAQASFSGGDGGRVGVSDPFLATDAVVFSIAQRGVLVGRGAHATEGRAFSGIVADFTTPRQVSKASDFKATIEWGDGNFSDGVVVTKDASTGVYRVLGTHQYDAEGSYPVSVKVIDQSAADLAPAPNINISRSALNQNSGSLAIDPTNPLRLAAVMVDEGGEELAKAGTGGGIVLSISKDGGMTWSPRLIGTGTDGLPAARTDPDVIFDANGNLFVTYVGAAGNNAVVLMSTDGGKTFPKENVQQVIPGGSPTGALVVQTPKLATTSEPVDSVWLVFRDAFNGQVSVAKASVSSFDLFEAFSAPVLVPGSQNGTFPDISGNASDDVVVTWQGPAPAGGSLGAPILVSHSDVKKLEFGPSSVVLYSKSPTGRNSIPDLPFTDTPLSPRLAEVHSIGPDTEQRRLFLTYSDFDPGVGSTSVYLVFSDDHGLTWSEPAKVKEHSATTNQFLPGIAVDPLTGDVAVTWYQSSFNFVEFDVATSFDNGLTFSPGVRASEGLSNATASDLTEVGQAETYERSPKPVFYNNKLYPIWSDNNVALLDGNPYLPQYDVAIASLGVIEVDVASPTILLKPIEATVGQAFTGAFASFVVPDAALTPADFEATLLWGDAADGAPSSGVITQEGGPGTPFLISGTHTYTAAGSYPLSVKLIDLRTNRTTRAISNVSAQQGSQGQPTIAIDPTDGHNVFAAWVDASALLPVGIPVATSDNGGLTWKMRTIADGSDFLPPGRADASAAFDQFGNLFLAYVTRVPDAQVVVLLSTDGGASFTLLREFADTGTTQPSIATGPGQGGKDGSVWVTWEQGGASAQTIEVAGASVTGRGAVLGFEERLVAPQVPDGLFRIFGDIAVGPKGQVLVTYSKGVTVGVREGPVEIVVQLDPDGLGNQPFGPPIVATSTNVGLQFAIAPQPIKGIDPEGNLAWDRSDGEHGGRVYLVYTDADTAVSPDTDILLRYSDDNGVNWSSPTEVDRTPTTAFLPAIAVDQSSGNVAMAWYTSIPSEDGVSTRTVIGATLSDDGGQTVRFPFLVSNGAADATLASIDERGSQFEYGGFMGLAFANGIFQPIWSTNSDALDSIPDAPNLDIANARVAIAEVLRPPLVVQMVDVKDREGTEFTRQIATFTDPDGGAADDYKATIDWGDDTPSSDADIVEEAGGGFSVSGTHEYKKFGSYTLAVTIKGKRIKGEGAETAVIEDAPLDITIPADLRVVRETDFTKEIATFTDLNHNSVAADFDTTIDWGDGSFSDGTVALTQGGGPGEANSYSITGTHKYFLEQTFTVKVSVRDKASGHKVDESGSIVSGDPPLEVQPGLFLDIQALQGVNTGDLELVTFTVPDDIEVALQTDPGEYRATINWGDGTVDANIIPFVTTEDVTVTGRHTYVGQPNDRNVHHYQATVTVQDDSGGVFSVPLIATVEPDVTYLTKTVGSGLIYNPATDHFAGDLVVTSTFGLDIPGPFYIVIDNLPDGVKVENAPAMTADDNAIFTVNELVLAVGTSLPAIPLEFSDPSLVPISYRVRVIDGPGGPAAPVTSKQIVVTNKPISAVEGAAFSGVVASFVVPASQPQDGFTATIDWGDGTVSSGTILARTPGLFDVMGTHTYQRQGRYPVPIVVRDSSGAAFSATTTPADASVVGSVTYSVTVDTSALEGSTGFLSFQFNPGALPGASLAASHITHFAAHNATLLDATRDGATSGDLTTELSIGAGAVLNRFTQGIQFGDKIQFDVTIDGAGIAAPALGQFGDAFGIQLLAADGKTPLLSADKTGAVLKIDVQPDGTTQSHPLPPDSAGSPSIASASAFDGAAIQNAPVTALQVPFSGAEGAEISGVVATFASANPFEVATDFSAVVDWGDGTPTTPGSIAAAQSGGFTVTATHQYQKQGDYAFSVTVFERDGLVVQASVPAGAPSVQAGRRTFTGGRELAGQLKAIGDFNRDGKLDVAVPRGDTSIPSNNLILLGAGDGSFNVTSLPSPSHAIVSADFNNDGFLDMAVAPASGPILIYLGKADGTFQDAVSPSPNFGPAYDFMPITAAYDLSAGDLDHDGHLDLVVSIGGPPSNSQGFLASYGQFFALHGNGDGTFAFQPDSRPNTLLDRYFLPFSNLQLADMNGDGNLDVVALDGASGVLHVILGLGNGAFVRDVNNQPVGITTVLPAGAELAAIGDLNGDNKLDIAVTYTDHVAILFGNGDGTFQAPTSYDAPGAYDVIAADFNNDGKLDLAVTNPGERDDGIALTDTGCLYVLLNRGNGVFDSPLVFTGTETPMHLAAGDFNGDGKTDVFLLSQHGSADVLFGTGDGSFVTAQRYNTGFILNPDQGNAIDVAAAADLNGDSFQDEILLGVKNSFGFVAIGLGNGNGTFQSIKSTTLDLAGRPTAVAFGDVNDDGVLDMAISTPQGTLVNPIDGSTSNISEVSILLGNGDGTFRPRSMIGAGAPNDVVLRDINHDGNLDLIAGGFQNTIFILLGNGDGTFQHPISVPLPGRSLRIAVGDFNHDGSLDLAALQPGVSNQGNSRPPDSQVYVVLNKGDGTFLPATTYGASPAAYGITAADLNGDGLLDLIVAADQANYFVGAIFNEVPGNIGVLLNKGDGTFNSAVQYGIYAGDHVDVTNGNFAGGYFDVTTADIDNDGHLDIIAVAESGATYLPTPAYQPEGVVVLRNQGDGTFGVPTSYDTAGVTIGRIAVADFNGDSLPDILTPNTYENTFSILFDARGSGRAGASIADAAIDVTGAHLQQGAGQSFTRAVGAFHDANPFSVPGDFTATIDWGDGQSSAGTIEADPLGGFDVIGTHTYAATGSYVTAITIVETGAGTHQGAGAALVTNGGTNGGATLTGQGESVAAIQSSTFEGVIATFQSDSTASTAADFHATIDWGDGSTTEAAIDQVPGGGFQVMGSHTYTNVGSFVTNVTIHDSDSFITVHGLATVAPGGQTGLVLSGAVFFDSNGNGIRNPGEPGIARQTVFLDLQHSGKLDSGDPWTVTAADGTFSFTGLASGSYTVSEAFSKNNVAVTGAGSTQVVTLSANVANVNFGNVPFNPLFPIYAHAELFGTHAGDSAMTAFVRGLYREVLNRDADADGLTYWVNSMTSGTTPGQASDGFVQSREHRQNQVAYYYQTFLDRAPDPASAHWVDLLMKGGTEVEVVGGILDSPEFAALHSANVDFVDELYTLFLHRSPDSIGKAFWKNALDSGSSRAAVLADFVRSEESAEVASLSFYAAFLHRFKDQPGDTFWVDLISANGRSVGEVASEFFWSTSEYRSLAAQHTDA